MNRKSLAIFGLILTGALGVAYGQGGWYPQNSGTTLYLFDVHGASADTAWAVGLSTTVLRTTDGGAEWLPQNAPPSSWLTGVHFVDTQMGWAVGSAGKIIRTTDSGDNWYDQPSGTSYTLWDVFFADELRGWAVGGKEQTYTPPTRFILNTTNGGASWDSQFYEFDKSPLHGVHFADSSTGCAVGDAGAILYTTDGGNTWSEQLSGFMQFRGVFLTDPATGWVVGRDGVILHTTNGGDNWDPQDSGTLTWLASVHFADGSTGWAVGGDATQATILHTTDGGANWMPQVSGTANSLSGVHFVDENIGWCVGLNGTILHTMTGGMAPPDVTITLTPYGAPIVIPASGGSFEYNVVITNNEASPQTFDAWVMATLPGGMPYGPVQGPVQVTLPGGGMVSRDRTQSVPAFAPPGIYTYTAFIGVYPGEVWDSDSFEFMKLDTRQ